MTAKPFVRAVITLALAAGSGANAQPQTPRQERSKPMTSHQDLVTFFQEWREFQKPRVVDGVPDYTVAAMAKQRAALAQTWMPRLVSMKTNTAKWNLAERNDYKIVEAELNGLDFDHRVLRPWSNDPSFYVMALDVESDVVEF